MKRILDEKGKGSYEFLTVVVVCLILASILLVLAIRNGEKEKREVFRYNAKTIGINAIDYEYRKASSIVYLYELIDDGLVSEVKNNFSGDKFCDYYESKVEFEDDKKLVTLKCGNYLIYRQDITEKDYSIYRVNNWTFDELSGNNIDVKDVYSLTKNGKDLLGGYYEEGLFVKLVMDKYGEEYNSLKDIKKDFDVLEKKAYRKRVLVD